jgi:microcystin-dependent protein
MKKIIFVLVIFILGKVYAQTGIGTATPHASAKLHVSATDKGFLPPRVTLTAATDVTTIPSPAEGLLVYNLGSMGLQAGYYYWNGANWATIATGTTTGNAVVAGDLVKLYHEAYSTTAGKAPSTDGFSFTVPVSGRYEFNFNSTAWNSNGSKVKLTFNIRQGTTNILAFDYHESTSSNVWAEYEGRVEVNLNTGITYNVQIVTTTGQRDNRDFDKIFYKMVAGNLPVNQHMAERNIQLNNNFLSNDGGNEGIRVDNSGNVTLNGSLSAGGNSYPTTQGTNGHSLTTNGSGITSWNSVPPVGVISAFAGSTAPSGYLLCDGSQVSRTTYSSLFAIIGTTYGVGNGTTTFNLPDLRSRTIVGAGQGASLTNRTLASRGGIETKTLAVTEIPSHSHSINDPGHRHNITTVNDDFNQSGGNPPGFTGDGAGSKTWTNNITSSTTGITINNTGDGTAFSIMNPFLALNYIIKF